MDTKALAKSKRAHSLRHAKKNNVHSASKVPSSSSGIGTGNKKPLVEQVGENLQKHHGFRALPSNWDRYGEEFDVGPGDPAGKVLGAPIVVPKSRGADYISLLSEAKSQPQLSHSADVFPTFSDILDDFTQGFGPMLSAKGQSILSWIAEDDFDFDMEEKPSISFEAPFLTLDLHALAEKLQKTKLSERLYVDPNVLPPELLNDELQSSGEDKDNQTSVLDSEASSLDHDTEEIKKKNTEHLHVPASTATVVTTKNMMIPMHKEGLHPTNQMMDDIWKSQETAEQQAISKSYVDPTPRKPALFEAASAEAELDDLLNSFSDTNFFEPATMRKKTSNGFELYQEKMPGKPSAQISSVSYSSAEIETTSTSTWQNPRMSANMDDELASLLKDTSNVVNIHDGSLSHEAKKSPGDKKSNLNAASKSKLVDDFDSWLDTI